MTSRFTAQRVRPANRNIPREADGTLPERWLLIEWPEGQAEPTDYWISTLPVDTPISEIVRLGKIRWRIEHDHRELKHGPSLDHFEGRTWIGWMHHTTLVTAAHLIITEERLKAGDDPKATGQPELLRDPRRSPDRGHPPPQLPLLQTRRTNLTKYY